MVKKIFLKEILVFFKATLLKVFNMLKCTVNNQETLLITNGI